MSLNSNATKNIETINKLSDRLCSNRIDKLQCEEVVNAIVALSIYSGYASGICNIESGAYNQLKVGCSEAQKEMQKILKKVKIK